MGLCNISSAFQRLMRTGVSGLTYEMVLAYRDEFFVFGRSLNECLDRLERVLTRIEDANTKLSPSKWHFFLTKLIVVILGHVVSDDGNQTDPKKVKAVEIYPVQKTVKQLRAFSRAYCNLPQIHFPVPLLQNFLSG